MTKNDVFSLTFNGKKILFNSLPSVLQNLIDIMPEFDSDNEILIKKDGRDLIFDGYPQDFLDSIDPKSGVEPKLVTTESGTNKVRLKINVWLDVFNDVVSTYFKDTIGFTNLDVFFQEHFPNILKNPIENINLHGVSISNMTPFVLRSYNGGLVQMIFSKMTRGEINCYFSLLSICDSNSDSNAFGKLSIKRQGNDVKIEYFQNNFDDNSIIRGSIKEMKQLFSGYLDTFDDSAFDEVQFFSKWDNSNKKIDFTRETCPESLRHFFENIEFEIFTTVTLSNIKELCLVFDLIDIEFDRNKILSIKLDGVEPDMTDDTFKKTYSFNPRLGQMLSDLIEIQKSKTGQNDVTFRDLVSVLINMSKDEKIKDLVLFELANLTPYTFGSSPVILDFEANELLTFDIQTTSVKLKELEAS